MQRRLIVLIAALACAAQAPVTKLHEWPAYAADASSTHYSTLEDIDREKVTRLQQVWEWKTGEEPLEEYGTRPGMFENTPLMIDDVLYLSTPYNRVVALNAETGAELWALRSEGLRRWPAAERNRLRAPWRRGVA